MGFEFTSSECRCADLKAHLGHSLLSASLVQQDSFPTVVAKEKHGKVKKRLILDLKRSGISNRTRKTHRVTLPRLSDLIQDILQLLATKSAEQEVEGFVLEFANAFWQIPLAEKERRYFIGYDGVNLLEVQEIRSRISEWAALMGRILITPVPVHASQALFPEARSQ